MKKRGARKSKSLKKVTKSRRRPNYTYPAVAVPWASPSLAPQRGKVAMKFIYSEPGFVLSGSVLTSNYIFQINGLYDPNIVTTGHQPMNFDQLLDIWEQYCVYGCAYRAVIRNSSSTISSTVGVTISDASTPQADRRNYIENGSTQWKNLTAKGTEGELCEFSGYVDIGAVHGLSKEELVGENSYKGNKTVNPTEGAYLHLWSCADDGSSTTGNHICTLELVFYTFLMGNRFNTLS